MQTITNHRCDKLLLNPGKYIADQDEEDVLRYYRQGYYIKDPVVLAVGCDAVQNKPYYVKEKTKDAVTIYYCTDSELCTKFSDVLLNLYERNKKNGNYNL